MHATILAMYSITSYITNIFHADKTFYSPCPNLEGINDALCKCSGLVTTESHVHNSRAVCTNIVVMEMHFVRARSAKHLVPCTRERGLVTVIPVSRVR